MQLPTHNTVPPAQPGSPRSSVCALVLALTWALLPLPLPLLWPLPLPLPLPVEPEPGPEEEEEAQEEGAQLQRLHSLAQCCPSASQPP